LDAKEISGKIGQAIDMMTAVRKEIEKEGSTEEVN
jgi:hypothetical protein